MPSRWYSFPGPPPRRCRCRYWPIRSPAGGCTATGWSSRPRRGPRSHQAWPPVPPTGAEHAQPVAEADVAVPTAYPRAGLQRYCLVAPACGSEDGDHDVLEDSQVTHRRVRTQVVPAFLAGQRIKPPYAMVVRSDDGAAGHTALVVGSGLCGPPGLELLGQRRTGNRRRTGSRPYVGAACVAGPNQNQPRHQGYHQYSQPGHGRPGRPRQPAREDPTHGAASWVSVRGLGSATPTVARTGRASRTRRRSLPAGLRASLAPGARSALGDDCQATSGPIARS